MGRKVDVLVEIHKGIIEEVVVLPRIQASEVWTTWGKEHGYTCYQEFLDAVRNGIVEEELRWYGEFDIDEGFKSLLIKIRKKDFNPSVRQSHEINK